VTPTVGDPPPDKQEIVRRVRDFVERELIPRAGRSDHGATVTEMFAPMKQEGLFGLGIRKKYGGAGVDLRTFASTCEEIGRGSMSIAGALNNHLMVAYLLGLFGTEEQRNRFLPYMATGGMQAAFSMAEADSGSDVQAITTRALRDGDQYAIDGTKTWVTNGEVAAVVATLVRTDPTADPASRGMSCILAEKGSPGMTSSEQEESIGDVGVETTTITFKSDRQPVDNLLGDVEGKGCEQMMSALDVGRVNVAAISVGVAQRALELSLAYAQQRKTFGKPIGEHQSVEFLLADMGTRVDAARLMTGRAATVMDAGFDGKVECAMAKTFATEACVFAVSGAMRIHGAHGFSPGQREIARIYRDAPLLLLDQGTNDTQRMIVARALPARFPGAFATPTPRKGLS
jgi:alkylation response protein AidB-like acyl-CoA dehydrogenase